MRARYAFKLVQFRSDFVMVIVLHWKQSEIHMKSILRSRQGLMLAPAPIVCLLMHSMRAVTEYELGSWGKDWQGNTESDRQKERKIKRASGQTKHHPEQQQQQQCERNCIYIVHRAKWVYLANYHNKFHNFMGALHLSGCVLHSLHAKPSIISICPKIYDTQQRETTITIRINVGN